MKKLGVTATHVCGNKHYDEIESTDGQESILATLSNIEVGLDADIVGKCHASHHVFDSGTGAF